MQLLQITTHSKLVRTQSPVQNLIECSLGTYKYSRLSSVTPISKTGLPNKFKDCRPIPITFHCGKTAESESESYIRNMLGVKSANCAQLTFTKGIGSIDALPKAVISWKMSTDSKKTLVVYALV